MDSGVINRTEEQTEIWSEFDELGLQDPEEYLKIKILILQNQKILQNGLKQTTR